MPAPPSERSERATERSLLRHAVRLFVAGLVAVFVVLAVLSQVRDLPRIDWRFELGWLALSLGCLVAFQAMHAETWRRMLAALGSPLALRRGWEIWNVSLLARYVPTQLLMVATRVSMTGRDGVPRRVALASIVYEFLLAVGGALVLSVSFVLGLEQVRDSPLRWLVLAVPVVMLVCLHPALFDRLFTFVAHRLGSERLPETLSIPQVLAFALAYILSFVVAGLGVFAFAHSLHPIEGLPLAVVLSGYAVGYTGAVLAFFVPGGLGVREGGVVAVLAPVVPLGVAIATAVAVRLVQTAIELSYAGLSTLAARRKASVSRRDSGVPIS